MKLPSFRPTEQGLQLQSLVAENQTAVTTVTSTDVDASATATYSISGGADAAKFAINATTGVLTFVSAPNYEIAADLGANNVYDVTVQVSDGTSTDTQAIAVTVTNTNETPTDLLYRPNVPSANLVADFEFGAVAATTLDDSGNGHNLTMSGTLSTTTGPTGSVALDLTGGASGNYGNIAGITTGGAMTVSTTVRFDLTGNWERIYDFGQASSGGIGNMYQPFRCFERFDIFHREKRFLHVSCNGTQCDYQWHMDECRHNG